MKVAIGRSRARAALLSSLTLVVTATWMVRALARNDTGDVTRGTDGTVAEIVTIDPPSNPSVLWIVLDEAPLWPLLGTDGAINESRWPGFAELARTSTWYRDTLSPAQWTYFAVPAMLDSKLPTFKNKPILRDHPENLFTALEERVEIDVRETITSLCPARLCPAGWRVPRPSIPDSIRSMTDIVEGAAGSTTQGLHFVHTLLPHRPWHLSVETRLAPAAGGDSRKSNVIDRRRDLYQSHLRQYVATDGEILAMVTKMRGSPNWDRTMIVVTADHGITFAPGESVRDSINTANPGSMEDVFRVPLFIKYPGQVAGAVSDCVASTMDILPTVLETLDVDPSWEMDGRSLAGGCPDRRSRRVRWPGGSAEMTSDFSAVRDRVRFYDEWVRAEGGVDAIFRVGLSGSLVGTRPPAGSPLEQEVTWTLHDPGMYQQVVDGYLGSVPVRATGSVRNARALGAREEGLLVVDGTIVGVMPELSGAGVSTGRGHYFNTNLLTRALRAGAHDVELWLADWGDVPVKLRRVGPPSG